MRHLPLSRFRHRENEPAQEPDGPEPKMATMPQKVSSKSSNSQVNIPTYLAPLHRACTDIGAELEIHHPHEDNEAPNMEPTAQPERKLRVHHVIDPPELVVLDVNRDYREFLFRVETEKENKETYYVLILPQSKELQVHRHPEHPTSLPEYHRSRMPPAVQSAEDDYIFDREAQVYRHRTLSTESYCKCAEDSHPGCPATEHPTVKHD